MSSILHKSVHDSNYRAELLGALCCLLVVKAACDSSAARGVCKAYCNNKEIVLHCTRSKMHDKLKRKQSQDDLV